LTDYDRTDLPSGYDRARDHGPEVLELWMRAIAHHLEGRSITHILDLGCGTGRFTEGLAAHFNAEVIGLDPSVKMLQVARDKRRDPRVHYEIGRAEAIPLPSESLDLVFLSMSLHHFTDATAAARECRRVLRNSGSVVIRTGTREQMSWYPYVPFFASSRSLIEETLPGSADVCATFEAAGLQLIASTIITQTIAPDWMVYAEKLAAGGDSVLARLSREEFEDGLAAVRRHATIDGLGPVVEPIDLFVFAVRP
jgi:ubiquinone/menaquinone biosynthesis C-methylase UbiE